MPDLHMLLYWLVTQALQNWWLSVWSEATADAEAREQAVRTSY